MEIALPTNGLEVTELLESHFSHGKQKVKGFRMIGEAATYFPTVVGEFDIINISRKTDGKKTAKDSKMNRNRTEPIEDNFLFAADEYGGEDVRFVALAFKMEDSAIAVKGGSKTEKSAVVIRTFNAVIAEMTNRVREKNFEALRKKDSVFRGLRFEKKDKTLVITALNSVMATVRSTVNDDGGIDDAITSTQLLPM